MSCWGKSISGRENSTAKAQRARECSGYLNHSKEASWAGVGGRGKTSCKWSFQFSSNQWPSWYFSSLGDSQTHAYCIVRSHLLQQPDSFSLRMEQKHWQTVVSGSISYSCIGCPSHFPTLPEGSRAEVWGIYMTIAFIIIIFVKGTLWLIIQNTVLIYKYNNKGPIAIWALNLLLKKSQGYFLFLFLVSWCWMKDTLSQVTHNPLPSIKIESKNWLQILGFEKVRKNRHVSNIYSSFANIDEKEKNYLNILVISFETHIFPKIAICSEEQGFMEP